VTRHPFARRVVAGALLAATLAALPARAALFDDEEARKRIEATNQRLTQVQRQLEDRVAALESQLKSQGLVDLFNQIEQIKADIARLRGQIEVLTHEQGEAQKRQRDLYVDLDSRLRKLEGPPGSAAVPAPPAATGAGAGAPAGPAPPPAPGLQPIRAGLRACAIASRGRRRGRAGASVPRPARASAPRSGRAAARRRP
jgi:TolA-binding protein